jgi:hypothetical protein
MAPRNVIAQLSRRIDRIAERHAPRPKSEIWLVERDKAWPLRSDRSEAIDVAEMRARPCSGHRIERLIVHNDPTGAGWLAACCLPGGECYALHGDSGGNLPPGWTEPA